MNSPSLYFAPARYTVLLVIISTCLLLPCCQTVQAINLGKLCAHFGHSCYGGNWGKRAVLNDLSMEAPQFIPKPTGEDQAIIDNNRMGTLALEQFRSHLLRQRLRALLAND